MWNGVPEIFLVGFCCCSVTIVGLCSTGNTTSGYFARNISGCAHRLPLHRGFVSRFLKREGSVRECVSQTAVGCDRVTSPSWAGGIGSIRGAEGWTPHARPCKRALHFGLLRVLLLVPKLGDGAKIGHGGGKHSRASLGHPQHVNSVKFCV